MDPLRRQLHAHCPSRSADRSDSAETLRRNRAGRFTGSTEELVALGHDVTLFASGDSVHIGEARGVLAASAAARRPIRDPNALHMAMLEQVRRQADDFDILHFHLDYYPFSLFSRQSTPFVTTLHGRLDLPEHQPVFDTSPRCRWSRSRMRSVGRCHRRAGSSTIHHGLPDNLLVPHAGQAVLPRVPRPHRAGEARRPGDPDRRACGFRSRSRRRSTARIATTSRARSSRCSTPPHVEYHRRDRRQGENGVPERRASRCWCRSIGPNRSAW